MRMVTSRIGFVLPRLVALAALLLIVTAAHAQPCGDPDGDNDVTDADGVIALQAAAGLETSCSFTTCDINTDDVIDDTDAVLIFRKAAEFEVEENCLETSSGPVDQRVNILVQRVQPFLEEPFRFVPQIGGLPTPPEGQETLINCDNVGDGDILIEADKFETLTTFSDCRFGNTFFDGDISDGNDGFIVSLTVLDQLTDDDVTYEADSLVATDSGSSLRISGTFLASPFFSLSILEDASDFDLSMFLVEITPDGNILGGTVTLDLAEAELPGLLQIEMVFDGTNIAVVTVTDDAFGMETFLYDLTGRRFL